MKTKILIGLLCIAAVLAWTGMVGAQTAPPAPKVQLPSGETVWDLTGDWDTFNENYGTWAQYGIYPNVYRITQTGSTFGAIRLKHNPSPSVGRAATPSLQGELDRNGFKRVEIVGGAGEILPCKGQISEDGKKIVIDDGVKARVTLTRSGDRAPLVGLWRLVAFQREYQATGEIGNEPGSQEGRFPTPFSVGIIRASDVSPALVVSTGDLPSRFLESPPSKGHRTPLRMEDAY